MRQNLKLGLSVLSVWGLLSLGLLAAQEVPRKIGYAVPTCWVSGSVHFKQQGSCSGQRIDYIGKINVVLAFEELTLKFKHPLVHKYDYYSLTLGYRFDLDFWLGLLTDREIPVLSSMHITLAPLNNTFFGGQLLQYEKLYTEDYNLELRQFSNTSRIEVGWRFLPSWDVFLHYFKTKLGPFALKNSHSIKRQTMTIEALYLGMHYTFGS